MNTDSKVIKQMRQGDDAAFDLFIHKYYSEILKYCTYHCSDREEAKDLTQETFLRFFSGFSSYAHRGKAKNYLYTIAGNLCKNYYRHSKSQLLDSIAEEFPSENQEDALSTQVTVRMCLDQLSEGFREVIILYYYQGLRQTEIADVLGIGLPLVKYRLKKAKEQLEKLLDLEDGHGY